MMLSVVKFLFAIICINMVFFTDTTLHTYSILELLLLILISSPVCRVVNGLLTYRIGAIGARPAGFQTVCASETVAEEWLLAVQ